ncbi:MAG: diguanylate cyclase [Pseudomonadota bacterium]
MAEHNSDSAQAAKNSRQTGALQLAHFDDATALRLQHAFGDKTRVDDLLRLLFTQLRALCRTSGLEFTYAPLGLSYQLGQVHRHTAQYNLHYHDQALGTLTQYFSRAQNEQEIQTAEDLLSLALVPLRNALTLAAYAADTPATAREGDQATNVHTLPLQTASPTSAAQAQLSNEEQIALAEVAAVGTEQKSDALILVSLDGYAQMVRTHGEEWAHIIMSTVHHQIDDGLRSADGVYHIGDDLIAVLLPRTTLAQARQVADKVRVLVASLHLRGNQVDDQLTASMGISNAQQAQTAEQVMAQARQALQEARTAGDNQIVVFAAATAAEA